MQLTAWTISGICKEVLVTQTDFKLDREINGSGTFLKKIVRSIVVKKLNYVAMVKRVDKKGKPLKDDINAAVQKKTISDAK